MTDQYLDKETLLELVNVTDTTKFQAISKDSYSDTAIHNTIKKVKGLEPLFFAALQTSIVGFGNKTFGEFKMNDDTIDVMSLFREFQVKADLQQSANLLPGDLTPRRLQRFYRYQINAYLEANEDVCPYLWKKYSSLDKQFRTISFPGAESMISTRHEAEYLIETYSELDKRLGTNITERIRRVLLARGIITLT